MRKLLILPFLFAAACAADATTDDDGGADIQGEEKLDTGPGIEVQARIAPGSTDAVLTAAVPRLGYVFYAGDATTVSLEVTHAGSAQGLDTVLKVYGPRLADGSYPKTIATDDDAGYGKLSKIGGLEISIPGFYLVELTTNAPVTANKKARLALACDGSCTSDLPIQPIDEGLKWYRRSAERRAATLQAYRLATDLVNEKVDAGVPGSWGVVLDVDETVLNNSAYQQRRLDLGVGFSPASWTAWVNEKAALPIDGAVDFMHEVHALGGKVVLVTNRKAATECAQTETNLQAVGASYDQILCQVDVSDKNPRFDAVAATMSIQLFVGDNIQDFPHLTQDLRLGSASGFADFGDRFVVVPNPMYGSFDKNPA